MTKGSGLGKVKRDISMLFVTRCFDLYVNKGGKLSFLIPFTTYKTQAGAGFRDWMARNTQIQGIQDVVELYPFEGAVNRTSMITLREGATRFPIPCTLWHNPKSSGMYMEAELEEVKNVTERFDLVFAPIEANEPESPWMETGRGAQDGIRKAIGGSPWYEAHEGVNTALNGVYWIQILSKEPSGLVVTNPPFSGQKKKIRQVTRVVEPDCVYPFIRGRDVKRWYVVGDPGWIIIPHDPMTGQPIEINRLQSDYPNTYLYLNQFRKELEDRSLHKLWGKNSPFYTVYDIGDYTFYPFKVVWKRVGGKISGKAELSAAVLPTVDDKFLGSKSSIPYEKLMLISVEQEDEAHYVAAVLNSVIVQSIVASYLIETAISDLTRRIIIPKFSPENQVHKKLSDLSRDAHELAQRNRDNDEDVSTELRGVENQIDNLSAELYGITGTQLVEIRRTLNILKEGRIEKGADDDDGT
jgi:hypothetical protein